MKVYNLSDEELVRILYVVLIVNRISLKIFRSNFGLNNFDM